jgi:hypothetical protein
MYIEKKDITKGGEGKGYESKQIQYRHRKGK